MTANILSAQEIKFTKAQISELKTINDLVKVTEDKCNIRSCQIIFHFNGDSDRVNNIGERLNPLTKIKLKKLKSGEKIVVEKIRPDCEQAINGKYFEITVID